MIDCLKYYCEAIDIFQMLVSNEICLTRNYCPSDISILPHFFYKAYFVVFHLNQASILHVSRMFFLCVATNWVIPF